MKEVKFLSEFFQNPAAPHIAGQEAGCHRKAGRKSSGYTLRLPITWQISHGRKISLDSIGAI
ncbi:MAG: hypothetical protein A3I73_02715 [Omnitrophica bacterium RIFCSPLOWO2_02_FULL_45_16]|nr:MAG: hypothetical protein A3C51_00890 [Omnitrophica bacterium RIFCSPHIGHO2_02_FULL_46_20]OGW92879.1 MAG: hypothetical protein A3K16_05240 [Omnitrophica bacterium RIFCSPLOWO2_01_FULL_45_24]OGX01273.1 MAG: hypothetical protein A3I73_02715 [Omnitrophica bacterium RIFCSPLOWO2_02_FULL_45_16]